MVLAWQANLKKKPSFLATSGRVNQDHLYHVEVEGFPIETANRLINKCKAVGTLRNYKSITNKLREWASERNINIDPLSLRDTVEFICKLADDKVPLSELAKVSPGLTLLHQSQGYSTNPAVQEPYAKLVLTGAKREAAERKNKTEKATCLSKEEILKIVSGILFEEKKEDHEINKVKARSAFRMWLMYRSWCRFDCYQRLTTNDIHMDNESVTIYFSKAKNDQYYAGSTCTLKILGKEHKFCPKAVIDKYFKIMGFSRTGVEYLNCKIGIRKKKQVARAKESVSYTTALDDDKELAIAFGIDGKISEKSFKVSGVSEAFNRGISLEDAMWHGRWVGLGTPAIYCHLNKKKRMDISLYNA